MINYKKFIKELKAYKNEKPIFEVTPKEKEIEKKFVSAVKKAGSTDLTIKDIDVDLITLDDLYTIEDFYDKYYAAAISIDRLTFVVKRMDYVPTNCNFL